MTMPAHPSTSPNHAPFPPTLPFSYTTTPTTSTFQPTSSPFTPTPSRKRRAATPPSPTNALNPLNMPLNSNGSNIPWSSSIHNLGSSPSNSAPSFTNFEGICHREKRRRPNLANGFAGMSITPKPEHGPGPLSPLPTYDESQAAQEDVGDEEDDGYASWSENASRTSRPLEDGEVRVEVLPDATERKRSRPRRTDGLNRNSRVRDTESSSSPSPPSTNDGAYDSDVTFQLPHHAGFKGDLNQYTGYAQQPDSVEQPDQSVPIILQPNGDVRVEELGDRALGSENFLKKKRREEEMMTDEWGRGGRKRRKWDEGTMDMDDGMGERDGADELDMTDDHRFEDLEGEETQYDEEKRRGRTMWHEPERDRIVITSLSSPSGTHSSTSSRSPSPTPSRTKRHFTQPGTKGFTLSPSLLTHLLHAQREQFGNINPLGPTGGLPDSIEKGLILYRPLGIPPGVKIGTNGRWPVMEDIVKNWQDDEARFEDLDDDEDVELGGTQEQMSEVGMAGEEMMDVEGLTSQSGGDDDMGMDIE